MGLFYEHGLRPVAENKQKALGFYLESLAIAKTGNHKLEQSYALRHIAGLYQEQGDSRLAIEYFNQSLLLREEIGYQIYLAPALAALGDV